MSFMSIQSIEQKEKLVHPVNENRLFTQLKKSFLPPLIVFILFFTLWQLLLTIFNVPTYMFPKPSDIVISALENWGKLLPSFYTTALESIIGFLFSVVGGVAGAILLASSKVVERSIYPYAVILQTIPIIAVAPIIVIWFGAGLNSIVIIVFLIGFFPMLSNTLIGLNATDQNLKNLFYLNNATKWQTMWKLRIPAALPYIVAGLKVSCTLSVIGAIVGEYVAGVGGSQGGLGYAIMYAAMRIQTPYLFACGLAASLLGISFFLLVNFLSKKLLSSWHESEMKTSNK